MYVANFDEGGTYQWKTTNTSTAGTISVDGLLNTDAMEAAGLANHPAGQACRSRGANWYLPSHFELAVIYANRAQLGSANIPNSSNWYWSSSQTTSTNATAYRFDNNSTSSHSKNNGYRVRCVRR